MATASLSKVSISDSERPKPLEHLWCHVVRSTGLLHNLMAQRKYTARRACVSSKRGPKHEPGHGVILIISFIDSEGVVGICRTLVFFLSIILGSFLIVCLSYLLWCVSKIGIPKSDIFKLRVLIKSPSLIECEK